MVICNLKRAGWMLARFLFVREIQKYPRASTSLSTGAFIAKDATNMVNESLENLDAERIIG